MNFPFPLFSHGDVHVQIQAVSKKIAKDSLNAILYFERGLLYESHDELDSALWDFEKTHKLDSSFYLAHLQLARIKHAKNLDSIALFHIDQFIVRDSFSSNACKLKAEICASLMDSLQAIYFFEKSIELKSGEIVVDDYLDYARAMEKLFPYDSMIAGRIIMRGMEQLGFIITLYSALIDLEVRHENFEKAIHWTNKVIDELPRKESWLVKRADIYALSGNIAMEKKSLNTALTEISRLKTRIQNTQYIQDLKAKITSRLEQIID